MEVTFLGTGTSHGIPVLTCSCNVCKSEQLENKRLRSSILLKTESTTILIDTTPEFRIQAIRENITKINAVLYTHTHADHLHGIDDVRPYSVKRHIPIFGNKEVINEITLRFPYIFGSSAQKGGGKPNLIPKIILEPQKIGNCIITPIPIKHGILNINGYRINNVAYLTDCSEIPQNSYELLKDLDILIIGALRYRKHPTHFNIDQALEEIRKIKPKRAYLTHICHDIEHFTLIDELKLRSEKDRFIKKIKPAHDGLCLKSD